MLLFGRLRHIFQSLSLLIFCFAISFKSISIMCQTYSVEVFSKYIRMGGFKVPIFLTRELGKNFDCREYKNMLNLKAMYVQQYFFKNLHCFKCF